MRRLVVGCGYLGGHVARLWREAGDDVYATTRGARVDELVGAGLRPITLDVTEQPMRPLPAVDTVVFAVGRSRRSTLTMTDIHVEGLRGVLDALPDSTGRVIYISSTSVYEQHAGEWVDEASPCAPATEGGLACLSAERLLFAHAHGRNAVALRLAGLYGAGRLPLAGRVLAGKVIPGSPDAYLNLIHINDAAAAVVAAASGADAGQTFVVSDGHPVTRRDYAAALAARLGSVAPPFEGGPRLGKRVRNDRVLRALGLRLQYPSYRDGLARR